MRAVPTNDTTKEIVGNPESLNREDETASAQKYSVNPYAVDRFVVRFQSEHDHVMIN